MGRPTYLTTASVAAVALAAVGATATASGASSSLISTVAGTGQAGFLGDGGPGTSAQLNGPRSVAMLGDGTLLIADKANHRVRMLAGGLIYTIAGNGAGAFAGDGLSPSLASLKDPSAVEPVGGGYLIADTGNNRIRRVDGNNGGVIQTVAGTGNGSDGPDDVQAATSALNKPEDVSPTADGGYLIADTDNHKIRKVSPTGVVSTVAGTGGDDDDDDDDGDFSGDGGPATAAELDEPSGVSALSDGGYLIADTDNDRIRRVSPTGVISTAASGLQKPIDVNPIAGGGLLGLVISEKHRVRFAAANGSLQTLAGNGTSGFAGDGGPARSAKLKDPAGIAVTAEGLVYVADSGNHRVRKFQASLAPAPAPAPGGEAKGEVKPVLPKTSPPQAGRRVNVSRERGTVTVKKPGTKRYVKLLSASSIPVGSVVNTEKGAVRLETAANLAGKRQAAVFHAGTFLIRQRRERRPVAELELRGRLGSCAGPRARSSSPLAGISRRRRGRRGLWGRGRGRFRTRGRRGSATVRGTIWFTQDRCDGTLVRVRRGKVSVRDFARRRNVLVRAGRSYLARPNKPKRRARR